MSGKNLEFEVTMDYFHVAPARELYRKLREAYEETGSSIRIKTSHRFKTRAQIDYQIINGLPGESIGLLDYLLSTKQGETIQLSFEPPVSDEYLDKIKKRIKHLF